MWVDKGDEVHVIYVEIHLVGVAIWMAIILILYRTPAFSDGL